MSIISRFAPSPTGFLHLGHAFSAWSGRRRAGIWRLRLEDIDSSRCRPEFADAILEDLAWLGLQWDGAVRVQSRHLPDYQGALGQLQARGLLYPCFCTRSDIARAQSALHTPEPIYPGTCRHLSPAEAAEKIAAGAPYALRLNMAQAIAQAAPGKFFDEGPGWTECNPAPFGDIVLARRDIPTSYHLCAVHDDALQEISLIVRGEDLRAATHIHVLLQTLLGLPTPAYAHHRLITDATGKRLAKRDHAATLRGLRESGARPADILKQFEESRAA
jgi:glutamyl-Q tRNA(Asp) synthetase